MSTIIRARALAVAAVLLLPAACISDAADSHAVEAQFHKTLAAASVKAVDITNVSGTINVKSWTKNSVDVSALRYGRAQSDLDRTHVDVAQSGNRIKIETRYEESSSFFGSHNGASVDYTVQIPRNASVSVTNVSGAIVLVGIGGNVDASATSGRIDATLGGVTGKRILRFGTVSGPITLHIARNSDVRAQASTTSGDVSFFFPASTNNGFVGHSASGAIGKGTASITLHAVSGAISIEAQ